MKNSLFIASVITPSCFSSHFLYDCVASPEMKKGSAEMLKLMSAKTTYKVKNINVTGMKKAEIVAELSK